MSLRARLIALFCALAVGPLSAVGIFDYVRARRTLRDLVASQTQAIAERTAAELRDRYALRQSDMLLLSENVETQRLLRARNGGGPAERDGALAAADPYLRRAWEQFARSFTHVEFLDGSGELAYDLGEVRERGAARDAGPGTAGDVLVVRRPIRDTRDGRPLGTLVAGIRFGALLPAEAFEARFGRAGHTTVLDRQSGRVVFHPLHAFSQRTVGALVGPEGWDIDAGLLARERGSFDYHAGDTALVASFVAVADPPWTVVSVGALEEFAAPFVRTRLVNLLLVVAVTVAASVAFVLVTRRDTQALEALSAAADQVGAGNFTPDLPPGGGDEVGRLTTAFGLMVAKVRGMLREIESSRHMAAVGAFATQLSHEVRNPLTSLKLNLQSLERDAAAGQLPDSAAKPVGICLREIERLDRVVGGALSLGRDRALTRVPCAVHQILGDALDLVRAQLGQQHVTVETSLLAPRDRVDGDPENLKAVFLNLLINAAEAMPDGGTLAVATQGGDTAPDAGAFIRVRVRDTGVGVPPGARERIFEPFYSTKPRGTGFGLSVALRTVEEHGGRLRLEEDDGQGRGAAFLVELPLAAEETTA
jgi:signal transduction histidine kinase